MVDCGKLKTPVARPVFIKMQVVTLTAFAKVRVAGPRLVSLPKATGNPGQPDGDIVGDRAVTRGWVEARQVLARS